MAYKLCMHGATRWLSRGRGCARHIDLYVPILKDLQKLSETSAGEAKSKAGGLLSSLLTPSYMLTLLLFADVCRVTDKLCLHLQRGDVDVTYIKHVRCAIQELANMKGEGSGTNMKSYPELVRAVEAAGFSMSAFRRTQGSDPEERWRRETKDAFLQGIIDRLLAYWPAGGGDVAEALCTLFDPAGFVAGVPARVDVASRMPALEVVLSAYGNKEGVSEDVCATSNFTEACQDLPRPPRFNVGTAPFLNRPAILDAFEGFIPVYRAVLDNLARQLGASAQREASSNAQPQSGVPSAPDAEGAASANGSSDAIEALQAQLAAEPEDAGGVVDLDCQESEGEETDEDDDSPPIDIGDQAAVESALLQQQSTHWGRAPKRVRKGELEGGYGGPSMAQAIEAALKDRHITDEYKAMLPVMHLALVFPIVSVDVERSFSELTQVVTDRRTRLASHRKDQLMRVALETPDEPDELRQFAEHVADKWLRSAARRINK